MFIGEREIKTTVTTEEKTPGDVEIIAVTFADDTIEHFSKLMYDATVTEEKITLEQLRDRRIQPIVAVILAVLREWGVKLGELGYMSALLNRSLDFNRDSAARELWAKWMPMPLSVEDVDLIAIDRVLRAAKQNANASDAEKISG